MPGCCASARSCPTGPLRWLMFSALGAGEITLSGYVVPVAGVGQKLPAARRRGLTAAVVPRGNED